MSGASENVSPAQMNNPSNLSHSGTPSGAIQYTAVTGKTYLPIAPGSVKLHEKSDQPARRDGVNPLEMKELMSVAAVPITGVAAGMERESRLPEIRRERSLPLALSGLTTLDGTLIEVNSPAIQEEGLRFADVLGRKFWEIHWWSDSPGIQNQLREACGRACQGEAVRFDVPVQQACDSGLWMDFQILPVRDERQISHLVVAAVDVTQRKEAEEELRRIREELHKAQVETSKIERLATLGRLAGSVAHEMRTPISIVQNTAFFLQQTLAPGDETVGAALAELKRAVASSNHIINEMLDYVREPTLYAADFSIGDAILSATKSVSIPQEIQSKIVSGEELKATANEGQITRILINLIQNAIQAMPNGGNLEMGAIAEQRDRVRVFVRDAGCGIPHENLDKIFEPLFSTKARGIGLGLAIAKRYAQLNAGELSVESQVGRGSTFWLVLNAPSSVPLLR